MIVAGLDDAPGAGREAPTRHEGGDEDSTLGGVHPGTTLRRCSRPTPPPPVQPHAAPDSLRSTGQGAGIFTRREDAGPSPTAPTRKPNDLGNAFLGISGQLLAIVHPCTDPQLRGRNPVITVFGPLARAENGCGRGGRPF